jgi:phage I-like protein
MFEVAMASAGAGEPMPPEWIQLTPRGRVTARDGRPFDFNPEVLVERFKAQGLKLPIDFEHESDFTALLGARPARAWIVDMAARPDGTFAQVEWNADAIAALRAKSYRYISPTIWLDADGVTGRMMKGAALVTAPALAMPAIASVTAHPKGPTMLKDLLALLGLTEAATLDEAKAAVARLSAVDVTRFAPLAQLSAAQTEVATLRAALAAREEADAIKAGETLVDDAITAGKIAPAAREQYLALASVRFAETKAAIDAMPVVLSAGSDGKLDKVDPAKGATGKVSDTEKAIIARLGISEADFLKHRDAA